MGQVTRRQSHPGPRQLRPAAGPKAKAPPPVRQQGRPAQEGPRHPPPPGPPPARAACAIATIRLKGEAVHALVPRSGSGPMRLAVGREQAGDQDLVSTAWRALDEATGVPLAPRPQCQSEPLVWDYPDHPEGEAQGEAHGYAGRMTSAKGSVVYYHYHAERGHLSPWTPPSGSWADFVTLETFKTLEFACPQEKSMVRAALGRAAVWEESQLEGPAEGPPEQKEGTSAGGGRADQAGAASASGDSGPRPATPPPDEGDDHWHWLANYAPGPLVGN